MPSNVFANKPVVMMGASMSTMGTVRAQCHLRQIFIYLNPRIMNQPEFFVASAQNKFDAALKLTDAPTRDFLAQFLVSAHKWVAQSS